ncbi:hypothetical protein N5D45_17160, partial [Stenotrophomonas sp. GD03819]|uniref:hypothetical protein n=1 Tax=Stenotrophomonas sp. GD03819 TaxID=2975384 RepID=UPI0024489E86
MSERIQVSLQRRLRRCLRQAGFEATATATAAGRRWIVSKWLGRGGQAGHAINLWWSNQLGHSIGSISSIEVD